MNRRLAVVLSGLGLCVAGVIVFLLSAHAHRDCFAPWGSGTGVVPSTRPQVTDCTVANWSYSLAIVAFIGGTVIALLGIVVMIRDHVAPVTDRAS